MSCQPIPTKRRSSQPPSTHREAYRRLLMVCRRTRIPGWSLLWTSTLQEQREGVSHLGSGKECRHEALEHLRVLTNAIRAVHRAHTARTLPADTYPHSPRSEPRFSGERQLCPRMEQVPASWSFWAGACGKTGHTQLERAFLPSDMIILEELIELAQGLRTHSTESVRCEPACATYEPQASLRG